MAKTGLSKAFQAALGRPVLNRLATIPVFQQGQELFLHHRLTGLTVESDEAAAQVEEHLARLWMEDGFLQYECPCERGKEGLLCAHAVAVALAALEPKTPAGKSKPKAKTIDLANTDKILREQSSDTLVGLLLTWAKQDERLMQNLMTFAAQQGGYALDVKGYRAALKRRLKKPAMGAKATDWRRFAKAISVELDQITEMIGQGQAYAALQLASDVVMYLFTIHDYDGYGVDYVLNIIPRAFDVFVRAARQGRAEPAVLIPHVLNFYRNDIDAELEIVERDEEDYEGLEALDKLLGYPGQLLLAKAAEALVEPKSTSWEARTESIRMMRLAQRLYLAAKDYDSVERVVLQSGTDDYQEALGFARRLLQDGVPERAAAFVEHVRSTFRKTPPRELYWVLAECNLQLGELEDGFVALLPVLEQHRPADFEGLHEFAKRHQVWDQFRGFLLSDKPPGNPAAVHRHHWRFQVFMFEKDYASAWPIAVWHQMDSALAAQCAMEMREQDPPHAARVLATAAEEMLKDDRTVLRALGYLDAAAQLVLDHSVRPENLLDAMRRAQRQFGAYGASHKVAPHLQLWTKAAELLKPLPVSSVPGRRP